MQIGEEDVEVLEVVALAAAVATLQAVTAESDMAEIAAKSVLVPKEALLVAAAIKGHGEVRSHS
jgi:hypothetical protein